MGVSNAAAMQEAPSVQAAEPPARRFSKASSAGSGGESDEEDDAEDTGVTSLPVTRTRKGSVSAEAYGDFNKKNAYEPKIIGKDDSQKKRIREVLNSCWMFKALDPQSMEVAIDAMDEKIVP